MAATTGAGPAAFAQTIDGAAVSNHAPNVEAPQAAVAAPERIKARAVDVKTVADVEDAIAIRPISPLRGPAGERVLRLTGEEAEATFDVDVPEGVEIDELRLLLRSSVTVLPDQSELTVWVNGAAAATSAFDWFDEFVGVTLATPAFRPGRNTVKLALRHRHRIYCGVEASFSLWTEIAAIGSGALWPKDALSNPRSAFHAALQAQLARGDAIELRTGDNAPAELVKRIGVAISAHAGTGATAAVRRASLWSPAAGADLARVSLIEADVVAVDVTRGGDGAMVLRVAAPFEQSLDLDALFEAVETILPVSATPRERPVARAGVDIALSELGFVDSIHKAHVFRRDFDIDLPRDWLVLDDRDARLTLQTREWAQAHGGAVLTLLVNGAPAGSFRIDGDQRVAEAEREFRFAANLLRPGGNTLSLRGELPDIETDRACPPLDEPVIEILASSTIWLPPSPSFAEPGIAAALTGLSGDRIYLAAPADTRPDDTLYALATIGRPVGETSSRLAVLSTAELAALDLGELKVSRSDLRQALSTHTASLPDTASEDGLARRDSAWSAQATSYTEAGVDLLRSAFDIATGGERPLAEWLSKQPAVAVLLQPRLDTPNTLWLLLADDADVAHVAAAIARGRDGANGPEGQVAVLTRDGDWRSWRSPAVRPELLENVDENNALLVAGAYGSWAPGLFALIGLAASWLCALVAAPILRRTRPGVKK